MKRLLTNLIGRDVIIHLKSGEVLNYLRIIDIVENTLVASYGNTIYLVEINHIGQVIVAYAPNLSPQDLCKDKKDDKKDCGDKK